MGCLAAGRIQRSPSGPLILISSDIFAFSQHLDDIAGSDQAVGAVRRKSSPFQHVWQCLIYSGVYLFQFARHMALLLKTSSALPAHHCIRQASRPQGCPPSRVLSLPTAGAHCSSRWYRRASDDQSGRGPATVYALRAHRLRVKLYSNHPLSNASLSRFSYAKRHRCSAGQRSHFIDPSTLASGRLLNVAIPVPIQH